MMLAALAFTIMLACVKLMRTSLSAAEVMWWRGLVSLPILMWMLRQTGARLVNRRVLGLRCVLGIGAMFCFYTAASGLAVSDLALIHKLQPILIAVMAPLVLGAAERSGWRVALVLVAGLVGCAVLLAPKLDVGLAPGLWGLAATVFSAGAHLSVRHLARTDRPAPVVFWFHVTLTLVALAIHGVASGSLPRFPTDLWVPLGVCGVAAAFGQLLMTRAYALDRAAPVAAAAYVGPLWALAADVVVFGVLPGGNALVGGAIIIAAGLWLVLAQRRDTLTECTAVAIDARRS